MRSTTFSPKATGRVETRSSTLLVRAFGLDPAVLRTALLGDIETGHSLDATDYRPMNNFRHRLDVVKYTVDTKADQAIVSLRLDVDVAGPGVVGVLQHELDGVDDVLIAGLDLLLVLHANESFEVA